MKRAIVVGATSGIGRQLAVLLAEKGYRVGATGRRKERLEALRAQYPEQILISAFDITETVKVSQQLDMLSKELGGLDLLVLSSGVGELNADLDFAIEKETIAVNVSGFTAVADWGFKYFEKQASGHFAAITSLAGLRGSRHAPAYYATKAYQINYLEGLRQKAGKSKLPIFITDIRPGFVDTEMAQGEGIFWMASVERAALQMMAAIEKKKQVAYITKRWKAIAGLLRMVPEQFYNRM